MSLWRLLLAAAIRIIEKANKNRATTFPSSIAQ